LGLTREDKHSEDKDTLILEISYKLPGAFPMQLNPSWFRPALQALTIACRALSGGPRATGSAVKPENCVARVPPIRTSALLRPEAFDR